MTTVAKIALGVALGIFLVMGACIALVAVGSNEVSEELKSRPAVIRIEAPPALCWTGSIGGATREGCGNAEFDVQTSFGKVVAANAQKKDDKPGTLTIVAVVDGMEVGRNSTSAAYGVAQVASN